MREHWLTVQSCPLLAKDARCGHPGIVTATEIP
jgi:hypothetical protein